MKLSKQYLKDATRSLKIVAKTKCNRATISLLAATFKCRFQFSLFRSYTEGIKLALISVLLNIAGKNRRKLLRKRINIEHFYSLFCLLR